MRQPRTLIALLFGLVALALLGLGAYEQRSGELFQTESKIALRQSKPGQVTESSPPLRISIESTDIEAVVDPVGVDDSQAFNVPTADVVGWYEHGSSPGESGSTVLAAHVDFDGKPGAFFTLSEVRPGETISVESEGEIHSYRVVKAQFYGKSGLPTKELFSKEGPEVLTLITCGGNFDTATKSYENNFVVRAIPA